MNSYGEPVGHQLLRNTIYSVLYSYGINGPLCASGKITQYNRSTEDPVEREDCFRTDLRLPEQFRISNPDYASTGYDRGHLWNSADSRRDASVQMESFLLSNMSPQKPGFNRGIWKQLEARVRNLACQDDILSVEVWCGPWWSSGNIEWIGDSRGRKTAIPHGFWKVVMAESTRGSLRMWGFNLPNEESSSSVDTFQSTVADIEILSGIMTFPMLHGCDFMKQKVSKIWDIT